MRTDAPLTAALRRMTGETPRTYAIVRTSAVTLARMVAADCAQFEAAEWRRILA